MKRRSCSLLINAAKQHKPLEGVGPSAGVIPALHRYLRYHMLLKKKPWLMALKADFQLLIKKESKKQFKSVKKPFNDIIGLLLCVVFFGAWL